MPTEIPRDQLKPGHWYVGEGRLGPLAMWTGKLFVGPGYSMSEWLLDEMQYGERGFSPCCEFDEQRYRVLGEGENSHGQ